MLRSTGASIAIHILLFLALIWSERLSSLLFRERMKLMQNKGAITVGLTYKPTDTPMKKGETEKDLPPPLVAPPKAEEPLPTLKESKKADVKPKKEAKPKEDSEKKKLTQAKKKMQDILNQIKNDALREEKKKPKDDNFPTDLAGEQAARGTGGRATIPSTPGEQAIESAFRQYFELTNANTFRKLYPNANGAMSLRIVAVGDQFDIVSLATSQTTGFKLLDRQCELAIQQAIAAEKFSKDVLSELNGKEIMVGCKP